MSKFDEQEFDEKRLARRQRRKKSQVTAFVILALFILVIAGVAVFSVYSIKNLLNIPGGGGESAEEAAGEASSEEVVIETPETVDPEPEEMTEEDILNEVVDGCIAELSIEDKVAGLFIVTPEQLTGVATAVKAGSGTQDALSKYAVGGVSYFAKNIKDEAQITEMLGTTASMSKYPIFTIVSDEGKKGGVTSNISIEGITDVTDPDTASTTSKALGEKLFSYGFNLDIAPSIDISENGLYGTDAGSVKGIAASFASGIKESGVDVCVSSFPLKTDTTAGLTAISKSKDELAAGEYDIFKEIIENSNPAAIMMSNASFENAAGDNTPASLSSVMIDEELRNGLGYGGIVITGPLNEASVTEYYTSGEAAVNAIKSGADMIYLPENFEEAYNGLLEAVNSGSIDEARLDESLKRIYKVKYADKAMEIIDNK
ncbi:beta-N-acetylhexosaminidase [Butyrivibrio sp. XB500-5]|uniref:glycoside hydrolase family 3 N-terminal domain-containing protein n=1 Tax=Butyrivibrio sp. XB500-5 TaxID=2364880 RepID=UPI000EA9A1BF|nr:glycoside hydrolase family 3 N-terminal domain-containing protein [Butyrivibrio sp. XB500-5]RKM62934.1 beta-N-acetylhexosaminidase [Butyrivibrio sp. XB500-5]